VVRHAGSMRGPALTVNLLAVRHGFVRASAVTLALLAGSLGCRHQGPGWRGELAAAPQTPEGHVVGVELFVIGQPREGLASRAVAAELDRQLQAASAAQHSAIVVWLGADLGPPGPERSGTCPGLLFNSPALTELAKVVADHGASSWGLPGPDAWRCGRTGFEAAMTPLPYQQPGVGYVLRVAHDGTVALASSWEHGRCVIATAPEPPLVELVLLDLSYWVFPEVIGDDLEHAVLEQQRCLLEALAQQPGVPRLLISPIPIESAGTRGLGGRLQRTSFRYLPDFVQEAVAAGMFAGAIGALERDLQLSVDLSNAIIRGDRSFVARPIFAVVTGSAGGAGHTIPTSRGGSLLPDLWSEHTGFAHLRIGPGHADVRIHARIAGRWRQAGFDVPLDPAPLPALREPPTIQPCPSCDPVSGAADAEVFVPRNERPR
jgi:hypothetical protein